MSLKAVTSMRVVMLVRAITALSLQAVVAETQAVPLEYKFLVPVEGARAFEMQQTPRGVAQVTSSQADLAASKARETKQGHAEELQVERKRLEAEEQKADQAVASANREMEQARAEESRIRLAAAVMSCVIAILSILLLLGIVVNLKRDVSKSHVLDEPLLADEMRKAKKYEGTWEGDDGQRVTIQGCTLVHPDGKEEQIAEHKQGDEPDSQILYTHSLSTKKWYFCPDSTVVEGMAGKLDAEGRIKWDDGRVWVRTEDG